MSGVLRDSVRTIRDTPSGDCDIVSFELSGQPFMAISAGPLFTFNESISFIVHCDTREQIDHYRGLLSAVPAAEQCGWLKDKYSLSWQIVPIQMTQMLRDGSTEQVARLTHAFLKIKKFGFGRRASCRRRSDLTTGSSISPG